jgi:hypothetical protein
MHSSKVRCSIMNEPFRRHWSFIVTDKKCVYPVAAVLLVLGAVAAFATMDASYLSRTGNFIIGTGVWISMRYTLREGINRHKNRADTLPTVPGTSAINAAYFNNITFAIGDAQLQLHGFALVLLGSAVGSFGDLALKALFSGKFM